jgi:PAS domain S-box-containing protein
LLYGNEPNAFGERDVTMMELLSVVLSGAMAHAAEFEAKRDQVDALARFEATFASALTGMLLLDLDGRIMESNPAIQKLLGYDHSELEGRRTSEFVHEDDRRAARAAYLDMIAREKSSVRIQHRFLSADGRVLWVDASASLVRDADGRRSFAIAMIQDIAKRKEAEASLLRQAELKRSPGAARRADRAREPHPVSQSHRGDGQGQATHGRPGGGAGDGPRRLQGDQ